MDFEQIVVMKFNLMYLKFFILFKRVIIVLDQRLYLDNYLIVWENFRLFVFYEGFEVKRKGDQEFIVNIRFDMNYIFERFKFLLLLIEFFGIEVDIRLRIIVLIWYYVKVRKLQN